MSKQMHNADGMSYADATTGPACSLPAFDLNILRVERPERIDGYSRVQPVRR